MLIAASDRLRGEYLSATPGNGMVAWSGIAAPLLLIVLGCGLLLLGIGIWRDVERRGAKQSLSRAVPTSSSLGDVSGNTHRSTMRKATCPGWRNEIQAQLGHAWRHTDLVVGPSTVGSRQRPLSAPETRGGKKLGSAPRLQLADSGGGRTAHGRHRDREVAPAVRPSRRLKAYRLGLPPDFYHCRQLKVGGRRQDGDGLTNPNQWTESGLLLLLAVRVVWNVGFRARTLLRAAAGTRPVSNPMGLLRWSGVQRLAS